MKSQVFINQANQQIICTAYAQGKKHDFTLLKSSNTHLLPEILCLADKGYQGIARIHLNSRTPKKKPRAGSLTVEARHLNHQLAKLRIVVEHINRQLKIFKILSKRYRNRRKRFSLRFNLIAGFYNYELKLP